MAWLLAGPAQAPCTRARRLLSSMLTETSTVSFLIQTTQWYLPEEMGAQVLKPLLLKRTPRCLGPALPPAVCGNLTTPARLQHFPAAGARRQARPLTSRAAAASSGATARISGRLGVPRAERAVSLKVKVAALGFEGNPEIKGAVEPR